MFSSYFCYLTTENSEEKETSIFPFIFSRLCKRMRWDNQQVSPLEWIVDARLLSSSKRQPSRGHLRSSRSKTLVQSSPA